MKENNYWQSFQGSAKALPPSPLDFGKKLKWGCELLRTLCVANTVLKAHKLFNYQVRNKKASYIQ